MRTLLTGFGAFGTVVNNPTARIVAHFERAGAPGHDLTTRVLPVSFRRAELAIREHLTSERFDAALLLGVAVGEPELRLEQFGRLRPSGRTDCDGDKPSVTGQRAPGVNRYAATVPLTTLLEDLLAAGFQARLSEDAGSYVCNHTYFAALHAIASEELPTLCFFLHVPADFETFSSAPECAAMPLWVQIEAVSHALAWLRGSEASHRRSDGSP